MPKMSPMSALNPNAMMMLCGEISVFHPLL